MSKRYFLFLLFLFYACDVISQQNHFVNYNTQQGLASSECYALMQDSRGYLWVATDAGVTRYDGNKFKSFTESEGLPGSVVFKIEEDKKGRVWFFVGNGTLAYYENDKIYTPACNKELKEIMLQGKAVYSNVQVDEDGSIYIHCTYNISLKISPQDNYSKIEKMKQSDAAEIQALELMNGNYFTYSSATDYGNSCRINFTSFKGGENSYAVDSLSSTHIVYISTACKGTVRASGKLFFYTNNLVYEVKGTELEKVKVFEARINQMYADKEGNIWIAVLNKGVHYYEKADLSKTGKHFLKNQTVTATWNDAEGSYWFSTREKGIYYLRTLVVSYFDFSNGLEEIPIKKIMNYDSLVVFNYENHFRTDALYVKNGEVKLKTGLKIGNHDFPDHLLKYKDGFISVDKEIAIYDKTLKKRTKVLADELTYYSEAFVLDDSTYCTYNFGNFVIFNNERIVKKIPSLTRITSFVKTNTGRFLFSTTTGLHEYVNSSIIKLSTGIQELDGRINKLLLDKNGNIVCVTVSDGMIILSSELKKIGEIKQTEFESQTACRDIAIDDDGNFYIATTKGVYIARNKSKTGYEWDPVKQVSTYSGLPRQDITQILFYKGYLFLGTKSGIVYFKTEEIEKIASKPFLNIEEAIYKNDRLDLTGIELRLDYLGNKLQFILNGISYSSFGKVIYHYKLDGYDKEWQLSEANQLSYTNLPPGKYNLRVFTVDTSRNKSAEKNFEFTILTPFWMSGWFYALMFILFIVLSFILVLRIIARVKEKERKKTEINRLLSEYQMTALKTQMNPHFISNCINSIQHLILTGKNDSAYEYLGRFSSLVRTILELSEKDFILISQERKIITDYLELEKLRFEDKFEYKVETEGIDENMMMVPNMLLQPFAENAIWHGLLPSKKEKRLSIKMENSGTKINIRIIDSGIGIRSSSQKEKTNGKSSIAMKNINERIDLLKKKTGVEVKITVRDLSEQDTETTGTEILIELPIINNS